MTFDIVLVFIFLAVATLLFAIEIIAIDLVALLLLITLALTGLVNLDQALAGFSNPAVITAGAMFILSAGLTRTGISSIIGTWLLRFARQGETRLVAILMTITALLSSVMNNIGVAAMFLPVTLEIARRTGRPASRLLLPMAYGSLLGGLMLLIGTSSNLVVRDSMRTAGYTPLGMFDFTPAGSLILLISVLYMALIGRRFLPVRQTPQPLSADDEADDNAGPTQYNLQERLAVLVLPPGSPLAGKTLVESRIGRALGLNILSITRKEGQNLPAEAQTVLKSGDRLLVVGRLERINAISQSPLFVVEEGSPPLDRLISDQVGMAEFTIAPTSSLAGKSLSELHLRNQYSINVLAIHRAKLIRRTNLQEMTLEVGDRVLLHGPLASLQAFADQLDYRKVNPDQVTPYQLSDRLLSISIPAGSALAGHTLAETRLGAAYGLAVLHVSRGDEDWYAPRPDLTLQVGDRLVVAGRPVDIEVLQGLRSLQVERNANLNLEKLQQGPFHIVEVMLSPTTSLAGKTLQQLHFREKFGVSVLAIWRGTRAYRSNLADIPLQYGDALLCYGPQERFQTLALERDFVVLKMDVQAKPRLKQAPFAALIMIGVILSTILLGLPISIAAITGCVLMVLSRSLTTSEAYQSISWQTIFLIAAMMPLGVALQETGAAALLGNLVVNALGTYGPSAVLAGLMLLSIGVTQFMPSAVVAVIMSPIALTAALNQGISPYAYILGTAYALAASFLSPVAHPANILVMSPGGYRFSDYFKHGLPLSLIVVLVSILLLPRLFPY